MTQKTVFKRIIDGEIPARLLHDDPHCLAFYDVAPQAPVHFLVIPKKEIQNLDAMSDDDQLLLGHLMLTIRNIARELKLDNGYRVISNCGTNAGQTVHHLHFHVLAGKPMSWP